MADTVGSLQRDFSLSLVAACALADEARELVTGGDRHAGETKDEAERRVARRLAKDAMDITSVPGRPERAA